MAKKKRARRRRSTKRRRSMSESSPARKTKRRSGKRRSRKKGLSEIISHEGLKKAGKAGLKGLMGGGIVYGIDTLVGKDNHTMRIGANLLGALILGAGFDQPEIASGMLGALTYDLANEAHPVSEMNDHDYADEDTLEENPDALDEAGNPMYLAEDGNFYYLNDFELAEDGNYYLSETMQANLYPGYVNPNM